MFNRYLEVTKPGIILSNLISASGGFLLASKERIVYTTFILTLISVSLVVASSCIFNNYIDKDIDGIMNRTKNRVLVNDFISPAISLSYATLLGLSGFVLLWFGINHLSCWLGMMGFLVYVCMYTMCMKRYSIYSTLIGSISGAIPPVIGYCSVTNKLDTCAIILFTIFGIWQMPHFYSIAILHLRDYQKANIPVLPVAKGTFVTRNHIILYIVAFSIASLMLSVNGCISSYIYLIITTLLNLWWLSVAIHGYKVTNDSVWAHKIFVISIVIITSISIIMSIDFIVSNHNLFYYSRNYLS